MKPTSFYIGSAAFYSFSLAALVGYPAGAINSNPGFGPDMNLSLMIAGFLGLAFTIYSAIPKSAFALACSWFILPLLALSVYAACWFINPESVQDNASMVLYFSIFTFGGPLWVPLIAFAIHFAACANFGETNA